MSHVKALLENQENISFLNENQEAVKLTEEVINKFPGILKEFINNNPNEFIAEDIEHTYKNIRIFTEVATSQFIHEITTIFASSLLETEISNPKAVVSDYI